MTYEQLQLVNNLAKHLNRHLHNPPASQILAWAYTERNHRKCTHKTDEKETTTSESKSQLHAAGNEILMREKWAGQRDERCVVHLVDVHISA